MLLSKIRKEKGLTIKQVATDLGVGVTTYGDWERGKFSPSMHDLMRIADYFGVTPNDLFGLKNETALQPIVQRREVKFSDWGAYETTATLEQIEQAIYDDLEDIKHSFFQIGYKLSLLGHTGLYKSLGYETLVDYAEDKFGFGKSTTYNMIAVYDLASDSANPTRIKEEFLPFTYSQLTEMSRSRWAKSDLPSWIEPSDSVSDIKKFISVWNKAYDRGAAPRGNNLKEVLNNYGVTPAILPSKSTASDIPPGQTIMDFDELEKDDDNNEEANDFEYHQRNEEATTEEQPKTLFKQKIYSTPGRIREAIKLFIDGVDYRIIFDPDNRGMGVRVTTEYFAEQLRDFILKNWDEIFIGSGIKIDNTAE